jgi:DMSO/TMAO reductase YedYZ molybdopterin-dependent catalytic subunit
MRCAIACSSVTTDHFHIGEPLWRGVPFRSLLSELDVDSSAQYARIHAADGYVTVLPLESLNEALLVYEKDGAALSPDDGFPVRLIAPGLAACDMPKWIERIELSDSATGGYWEAHGQTIPAESSVVAVLRDPLPTPDGALTLNGVAYAGARPVESIEVSIDGGDWMPVPFTPAERFSLTHWHIDWTPPFAGNFHVRLRASDANGALAEQSRVIEAH